MSSLNRRFAWGLAGALLAVLTLAGVLPTSPAGASSASRAGSAAANACLTSPLEGRVAGHTEAGVCAFEGIPYAAPPVGARRFRPPQPVRPWRGVLQATRARAVCPQERDLLEEYPTTQKRFTDENCLYLNVWTPHPDHGLRPVMVFIPGGAFVVGSASEPIYNGSHLAARGNAVIVSLNYRLGILGWLELGGLDRSYGGSGNNGLRDQLAALRWVKDNIRAFGGDPRNVTVFGESAGAISISALLAISHPDRYFHRAILESGSGYLVHTNAYADEIAQRTFEAGAIHNISQLKSMRVNKILDLQNNVVNSAPDFSGDSYFAPYVDGHVLPGPVVPRIAAGNARDIDLLSGTNEDETKYWLLYSPSLFSIPPQANPFFPSALAAQQAAMIARYRADRPGASDGEITFSMLTDQLFRVPQIRLAQAQARWQRHNYMYWFRWHVPSVKGLPPQENVGAMHGIELGFVFGNLDLTAVPRSRTTNKRELADRRLLSNRLMDAWLSFARTGDPNSRHDPGVPAWPSYSMPKRATMSWNATPQIIDAPQDAERALWDAESFNVWDFTP
jgi:para-nitrobenzyl esterase